MTIFSICGLATTFLFKRDRSDPMASCCASSAATIPRSLAFSSQWNQKQNSIQNKCKTPEIVVLKKMSYHGISDSSPSFIVFHHVCSLFFCTGFRSFSRFETRMTTTQKKGPCIPASQVATSASFFTQQNGLHKSRDGIAKFHKMIFLVQFVIKAM